MEIDVREIEASLRKWVAEGKTSGAWGDSTILRVTQGVLSTLRDFGVLQGAVKKRIAPAYLSLQAFSYIVFYLKQHQPSGAKLLDLVDWKLFFLSREGVERFLLEAHQNGLLEYHVAGSVTRLTFPVGRPNRSKRISISWNSSSPSCTTLRTNCAEWQTFILILISTTA